MKANTKKLLSMLLVVTLIAVIGVGGIMAYLTSEADDVNVMTLGNVKIEQNEQQRVEVNGEFTAELEDFEQGKTMMPYVNRSSNNPDTVTIGTHNLTLNDRYHNYVDKIVTVTNTGKSDAYVRTLIAVPSGGSDWEPDVAAADAWLHWNVAPEKDSEGNYIVMNDWHSYFSDAENYGGVLTEINGINYYVWEFTHKKAIEPGYTTFPSMIGTFMDCRVDTDENGYYMDMNSNHKWDAGEKRINDIAVGSTVEILVVSQAVQADGFADAQTALNTAFGSVEDRAAEWFGAVKTPVAVATAEELADALAAGEDVYLTKDIVADANKTISVDSDKDVELNLNGNEIKATANKTGNQELFLVKGNMTVTNGILELTAENNQGWNAMTTLFDVTAGGVLNLDNVTAKVSGTDMNFIVHLNNWGEATVNIDNCDFTTSYVAVRAFNSGYDMNNVTIENTKFHGGRMLWVHNYTAEGKDDTTLNLDIYNNDNTSDNPKPVRFGFNSSTYFDLEGNEIA